MAEWLKATDCKSVLSRVRRFESFSTHSSLKSGSSSFGRAIAFQAIGGQFEPGLPLFLSYLVTKSIVIEIFTDDFDDLTGSMTFKSRCSSVAEHFLGKEEVKSSILFNGSDC